MLPFTRVGGFSERLGVPIMRQPYESPAVTVLGSVTELTQANFSGEAADYLLVLRGPADDSDPLFS